ncbi:MAG: hypothetical protein GX829_07130 [Clostridium sp.]|nr:hypothetical protein [Clostridium sp.]
MESKTYYPLSPGQLAIFYSRKYAIRKSVINIPTSLIIHESMDLDILEKAMKEAINRWDSFGIRLVKEGKIAKQFFGKREVESIERLDFTNKSREEMESALKKLGSKKLEIYDNPMARMYLLTTPEGYGGIFTVISHLIMDSWAITSFYRDLLEIYYSKLGKGEYPEDVVPYEEVLLEEIRYKDSPAYEKAKAYWHKEFSKDEPIYTHVNGTEVLDEYRRKKGNENSRASNSFFLRTTSGHDSHWIDKEHVEKFTKFIVSHQLPSLQVLFQMALRTYLAKANNHEKDVTTINVVARRGTLKEKKAGGTRVHFVIFRSYMEENVTFIQACRQLYNLQNELVRHADYNPLEQLHMQKKMYGIKDTESYHSVSMTFQPIPINHSENVPVESSWYTNGAVSIMLYITIMDGDGTGGLKCYYEYIANHISADTIKHLHESMVKIMLKGCENPEITLEELFEVF